MKVILLKDVKGTGKAGTVVEVADVYARNFILSTGFALEATAKYLHHLAGKRAFIQHSMDTE